MSHSGEAAAFAVEKTNLVKTDAGHADGMNDYRASTPVQSAGKAESAHLSGPGKALPSVDLYDSMSQGTGNWASLEGYTLAVPKTDPLANCLGSNEAQREAVLKTEAQKLAGLDVPWPDEKCAAELAKSISDEDSGPRKANHDAIKKAEAPRFKGAASWASLEGYTLENP